MKGLVFFILLVGAQLIASFPKELPIKDTEIKSQNSRQKRQDRPGLIDFSGTPPERPERPELALPGGLYPSGPYPKPELELKNKDGLDLDFGADLNLPEDVVKNADIDIGLRLNAMNFVKGGRYGNYPDCACIRDLIGEVDALSTSLSSIVSCLAELAANASAIVDTRSGHQEHIEDDSGHDLETTLLTLDDSMREDRERGYCVAGQFVEIFTSLSQQAEHVCENAVVATADYLNSVKTEVMERAEEIDDQRMYLAAYSC